MPQSCSACPFGHGKLWALAAGKNKGKNCGECEKQKQVVRKAKKKIKKEEIFTDLKTKQGKLSISSLHAKNKKEENIETAPFLADKYGYDIVLIKKIDNGNSADSFNRTLGKNQEYKINKTATINSIDSLLRKANKQADDVVLCITSDISWEALSSAIIDRLKRWKIVNITIIKDGKSCIYSTKDILSPGYKIQQADFKSA